MDDAPKKHHLLSIEAFNGQFTALCKCGEQSSVERSRGRARRSHLRHCVDSLDLDMAAAIQYLRGSLDD